MKITDIVPAEFIPALTWLGKQDWLKYEAIANGRTKIISKQFYCPLNNPQLAQQLAAIASCEPNRLFTINAISKALADGPKVLCPTVEQCLAMEHVDINVPFANYQQPYPVVFVDLPGSYRTSLFQRFGIHSPKYIVAHHDTKTGYVLVSALSVGHNDISAIMPPRHEYPTIEDALKTSIDTGSDIDLASHVQRIALNLCLLMTHYGVEEVCRSNQGLKKKLLKASQHRRQSKSALAKSQLAVLPTVIRFKQEISFSSEKISGDQSTAVTNDGTPKKPHWRRGHFRLQRIGEGKTETKMTFIKPVLINAHLFVGDVKDTKVVYRGKDGDV